jgi:lipopolysaccharide export system permease protein
MAGFLAQTGTSPSPAGNVRFLNFHMKILNRYLAVSLLKGYLPVLAIFLAVFSLIVFVDELDEVGKGRYTFWSAGEFLLLTLPSRFVILAPFLALLGSIMALGHLANGRELIAMQANGISPYQIAWSVMKVGAVFIIMVGVLEEVVTPPLDQEAYFKRSIALSDSGAYKGKQGFWFREGRRFVRIQEIRYGEIPQGIDIFEFSERGHLRTYLHAQEASVITPQKWILRNIKKQVIEGFHVSPEHLVSLEWDSPLQQKEMRLLTLPASSLAPSELYQYIEVLKRKKQNSLRYELSFWTKVFMPLNTWLMVLVAIPFVFGPLRTSTAGKRVFIGSLAGLGYYLMTEIFKYMGILLGLPPFLTTAAPFFILSGLTFIVWRRYLS